MGTVYTADLQRTSLREAIYVHFWRPQQRSCTSRSGVAGRLLNNSLLNSEDNSNGYSSHSNGCLIQN
eukprot:4195280-Pyramimonas_sp.AAC.1